MNDLYILSTIFLIIGITFSIAQFLPIFIKSKWLFIIGILSIGIGSILYVIDNNKNYNNNYENYQSMEDENYQQLVSGTVWADSENEESGLGWVL